MKDKNKDNFFFAFFGLVFVIWVTFIIAVIYVAIHFIEKGW